MNIKSKRTSDSQYEDITNDYANDLWAMFKLIEDDVLNAINDDKTIDEIERDILKLLE